MPSKKDSLPKKGHVEGKSSVPSEKNTGEKNFGIADHGTSKVQAPEVNMLLVIMTNKQVEAAKSNTTRRSSQRQDSTDTQR